MANIDQELLIEVENKTGLSGSDARDIAKLISDASAGLMEHHVVNSGGQALRMPVKVFKGGVWEPINYELNIAQGDVTEKAISKALVGLLSIGALEAAGTAVAAGVAAAGAPFIISFGVALAFGYYAGSAISEVVDKAYDVIVGPDFTYEA